MNRNTMITLGIVALMAVPTTLATWRGNGDAEPNTAADLASGRMYATPDVRPPSQGLRVYFNFFESQGLSALNPNVAALGTRNFAQGEGVYNAYLGVWKDCNKDGYIGQLESALIEYRAELLPDTSVCPVAADPNAQFVFNDGLTVQEFVWFGREDPCQFQDAQTRIDACGETDFGDGTASGAYTRNAVAFNMNDSLVWYDQGVPGAGAGGGSCPISPFPQGTFERTGGLISYVECFRGYADTNTYNNAVDTVTPGDPNGLKFSDPNHPLCADGALNPDLPANLWGDPCSEKTGLLETDTDDHAFKVFDCQSGTGYTPFTDGGIFNVVDINTDDPTESSVDPSQFDPAGVTVDPLNNRTLAPALLNPTGSYGEAADQESDAILGDCDARNGATIGNTTLESGVSSAVVGGKRTDFDFMTWFGGARDLRQGNLDFGLPTDPTADQVTDAYNETTDATFGRHFPIDGGVGPGRAVLTGPMWSSNSIWTQAQAVNRNTLQPNRPFYYAAYARLNHADLSTYGISTPTAGAGTYGSLNCATIGPGEPVQNGWECDPSIWYKNADTGADEMTYSTGATDGSDAWQVSLEARVGDSYDMLDVDCYDGHIASVGTVEVQTSLTNVPGTDGSPGAVCH